jgi:hypothetical protein
MNMRYSLVSLFDNRRLTNNNSQIRFTYQAGPIRTLPSDQHWLRRQMETPTARPDPLQIHTGPLIPQCIALRPVVDSLMTLGDSLPLSPDTLFTTIH